MARDSPAWIRVIDEELIGAHLGVANIEDDYQTAKRKLNILICWHIDADRYFNKNKESSAKVFDINGSEPPEPDSGFSLLGNT